MFVASKMSEQGELQKLLATNKTENEKENENKLQKSHPVFEAVKSG